jgi:hypothetical protein
MLLGISNLVECPKGIIPTPVSIGISEDGTDFLWQIFAPTSEIISKVVLGGSEGEFDGLQRRTVGSHSRSVSGLIEHGSEIVRGVKEDARKHLRERVRELDFVQILRGLRLSVNENGPWLALNVLVYDVVEIRMWCSARAKVNREL